MSTLPAELESLVCSFLSIAHLKSARQVNKRWAYISGPFLFEELWIAQPTFQKLEDVSCHDTLRFHVKKIVLYSLPVPVLPSAAWEDERRPKFLPKSPEGLASKFPRYKLLYDEQQRFASSDLGVATLTRAVDKLPQLLGLEARAMPPPKQWMQYFLPPLSSPRYLDDLAFYRYLQRSISIRDVKDVMKFMGNALRGLFQTRSGLKIKHFGPGIHYSHSIRNPSQATLGLALPENLKALEVHVRSFSTVGKYMSGLQDTLSKTLCLERLVLDIRRLTTHARCDFLEGFRPSLPKLEHLEICGGYPTEHSLTSFLTQYIDSLRSLRLDTVSLINQSPGRQSTSWLHILSIFLSEEWSLTKVTLIDLSYFHPDSRSKALLTAQCLLSIQDAICHKAALPDNEALR